MKRNITKQLCMCVAVYELLTALRALELALPEEEIPKHVRSMLYQFKVFKNVNYFMSLRRRQLDKARRQGCCGFVIVLCNVRRHRPVVWWYVCPLRCLEVQSSTVGRVLPRPCQLVL